MLLLYLQVLEEPEAQDKFTRAYLAHRGVMYQKALSLLRNQQDAEDVVQKAFLIILGNLQKFSDVECPKTRAYFVKIVENLSIDMLRKQKRHPTVELDEQIVYSPIHADTGNDRLLSALQKLPLQYQEILMYSVSIGLSLTDIAKILGITYTNARKRLWRAKEALRKQYEKEESL